MQPVTNTSPQLPVGGLFFVTIPTVNPNVCCMCMSTLVAAQNIPAGTSVYTANHDVNSDSHSNNVDMYEYPYDYNYNYNNDGVLNEEGQKQKQKQKQEQEQKEECETENKHKEDDNDEEDDDDDDNDEDDDENDEDYDDDDDNDNDDNEEEQKEADEEEEKEEKEEEDANKEKKEEKDEDNNDDNMDVDDDTNDVVPHNNMDVTRANTVVYGNGNGNGSSINNNSNNNKVKLSVTSPSPLLVGKSVSHVSTTNTCASVVTTDLLRQRFKRQSLDELQIEQENDQVLLSSAVKLLESAGSDDDTTFASSPSILNLKTYIAECKDILRAREAVMTQKRRHEYRRLILQTPPNNYDFFCRQDPQKQYELIEESRQINKMLISAIPPRNQVLSNSFLSMEEKLVVVKKLNQIESDITNEVFSSSTSRMQYWISTFLQIPFGKYSSDITSPSCAAMTTTDRLLYARDILDKAAVGMQAAKQQILQQLAVYLTNPQGTKGCVMGFHGSPGVGKTNLVVNGLSKVFGTNRPAVFIGLGGFTDGTALCGHQETWEGATCGRIVQELIACKCMDPIFVFDELDKVADTPRGEEIINILMQMVDPVVNNKFQDKYFAGINIDLSRCFFVFTYNHEDKISPILLDRIYRVKIEDYTLKDKIVICRQHLIPQIVSKIGFANSDHVILSDAIIEFMLNEYCGGSREGGVRSLQKCITSLYTALHVEYLMSLPSKTKTTNANVNANDATATTNNIVITVQDLRKYLIVEEIARKSSNYATMHALYS